MGDRAVVGFRTNAEAPTIYLYSHWGGSSMVEDLEKALLASSVRWSDSDYATRICISQIIGDSWDRSSGYGLSVGTYMLPDYDYILVVEWDTQKVYTLRTKTHEVLEVHSFDEWLALLLV